MNTADLLIKYTDHHGSVLITEKVFSVLGLSVTDAGSGGGSIQISENTNSTLQK